MEGYLQHDGRGATCALQFSFLHHISAHMEIRHPDWENYNVCAIRLEEIETPQVAEPAKKISQETGAESQVCNLSIITYFYFILNIYILL